MSRPKNTPLHEEAKKVVAKNLERLLARKNMTQVSLSEKTGIPKQTINGYLRGFSLPTPGNTEILSRVFDVSKEEIDPRFNSDTFKKYDLTEAKKELNKKEFDFFDGLINKALSLNEEEREDFFENVRFAIEFFDKKKK